MGKVEDGVVRSVERAVKRWIPVRIRRESIRSMEEFNSSFVKQKNRRRNDFGIVYEYEWQSKTDENLDSKVVLNWWIRFVDTNLKLWEKRIGLVEPVKTTDVIPAGWLHAKRYRFICERGK